MTEITAEVFTNQGFLMILTLADDIDAVWKNTVGNKERFLKLEKNKKMGQNQQRKNQVDAHYSKTIQGQKRWEYNHAHL